ncbi:MAG: precorrin-8X methylmutase [Nitrospirota bacterium]
MESIILIGHGSPRKEANNLEHIGAMLHGMLHAGCSSDCVKVSYLQFTEPSIMDTITAQVKSGATKVILHPFFLSAGMHVTKDIPEMIEEARGRYPHVEFVYTEPLGTHEKLARIVMERIGAAQKGTPDDIEKRSFSIIEEELDLCDIPAEQRPIVQRIIHATADFEFKKSLVFHKDAVACGLTALREGKDILTDVEMVKTGINKKRLARWGGRVICAISDEEVRRRSEETGATRAEIAIEKGLGEHNVGIIAIGNAPTALLKTVELLTNGSWGMGHGARNDNQDMALAPCPLPLVIGVPVGFVNAFESKALLAAQQFPFITTLSRKGGTPVAVAAVNALLKMAEV